MGVHAFVGAWLSLVEHSVRDRGVGGSNPLAPTNFGARRRCEAAPFSFPAPRLSSLHDARASPARSVPVAFGARIRRALPSFALPFLTPSPPDLTAGARFASSLRKPLLGHTAAHQCDERIDPRRQACGEIACGERHADARAFVPSSAFRLDAVRQQEQGFPRGLDARRRYAPVVVSPNPRATGPRNARWRPLRPPSPRVEPGIECGPHIRSKRVTPGCRTCTSRSASLRQ